MGRTRVRLLYGAVTEWQACWRNVSLVMCARSGRRVSCSPVCRAATSVPRVLRWGLCSPWCAEADEAWGLSLSPSSALYVDSSVCLGEPLDDELSCCTECCGLWVSPVRLRARSPVELRGCTPMRSAVDVVSLMVCDQLVAKPWGEPFL
jgi:hypothetical protein